MAHSPGIEGPHSTPAPAILAARAGAAQAASQEDAAVTMMDRLHAPAGEDTCVYEDLLVPPASACILQAVLTVLPTGPYLRALAIQPGAGAVALHLPASSVMLAETSRPLLGRVQKRLAQRPDRSRFALWHGNCERLPQRRGEDAFDLVFLDGLRLASPPRGAQVPLRLAVQAQLAVGGILLLLERTHAPLPAFAATRLQTLSLQVDGLGVQVSSYVG